VAAIERKVIDTAGVVGPRRVPRPMTENADLENGAAG